MPGKKTEDKPKVKAQKVDISQLVITAAYAKTFSSGKGGFFGKAMNPATGKKYQIIGAVELAS
ncbi:MAG: hypothetical protein WC455_13220 [Dehalococcoidia bacterium]|jgi:hypothetical protein